ncbi:hypothetical protein [Massilia sp. TN1-12]|uniref:hypothetical protein n=1 Tax=Massilia paldalensis TaxID=3377675 RepID=UPI0038508861
MQTSKILAAVLAATLGTTCHAQYSNMTPSQASMVGASYVVALPFLLVAGGSMKGSEAVNESFARIGDHSRWKVKGIMDKDKNQAEAHMQSEDGQFELTMTVMAPTVREQRLAAGDVLDVDRVGTIGYVVRKGDATIGVLVPPGTGAVHSKARG